MTEEIYTTRLPPPRSRFSSDPTNRHVSGAAGGGDPEPQQQQQHQRRRRPEEADGAAPSPSLTLPSAPPAVRVRDWRDYFQEQIFVPVPERGAIFHVYAAGPRDATATFLCLHGAGYTGATWALVARALTRPAPVAPQEGGGGGGGADKQQQQQQRRHQHQHQHQQRHQHQQVPFHDHERPFRVLAPDLRGHGLTVAEDEADLSAETMRDDVRALWRALVAAGEAGGRAERGPPPSLSAEQQQQLGQQQQQPSKGKPAVVVVGHSMGGAIAVHACAVDAPPPDGPGPSAASSSPSSLAAPSPSPAGGRPRAPPPPLPLAGLAGCVVVDVVEGTALAALRHARAALAARPRGFDSREAAARWALRSGLCRNREAAEVSAPTMVVERPRDEARPGGSERGGSQEGDDDGGEEEESDDDDGGEDEDDDEDEEAAPAAPAARAAAPETAAAPAAAPAAPAQAAAAAAVAAADARPAAAAAAAAAGKRRRQERRRCRRLPFAFAWRTPLARSAPHWPGWYRGLSALFLGSLPAGLPRALIAAGADRLDRALTVGQMQGRFQLVLVSGAGHCVQEDAPLAVAGAMAQLARRFRVGEPPLRVPPPPAPFFGGGRDGRVLPVAAGPMMVAPLGAAVGRAAALRAPSGTAAAATVGGVGGRAWGGGCGGGGDGEGNGGISIREEEDDGEGP